MIEETAVVTRVDKGRAWIRKGENSTCGGCMQRAACGTAALARLLPDRELEIEFSPGLQAGDRVRVAIDDAHLLSGSALVYLLPLLLVFAWVGLATALLPAEATEAWMPEIALAGLLAAFRMIHHLQKRLLRLAGKPVITSCNK